MRSLRRQDRDRFHLEQRAGAGELRHADGGAGGRGGGVDVFVAHLAVVRDVGADVDDVVVELDHVLEAGADRGERELHVLECHLHLFARIGAHPPGFVDAELAGEIDRAAGAGDLHHVAIARRLLHGVGARETNIVRHVCAPVG